MLADYQLLVERLVRDQSRQITTDDRDRAIEVARLRYSADLPRELVEDVTWPATDYFGPLPTAWVNGSNLVEAEYPIGVMPVALVDLAVYVDSGGQRLAAPYTLGFGSVVRVRFSAPHLLQDGTDPQDTIPEDHREAVASYAAALLCKQLASHFSGERETSIGADGSNTESRARNYAARAKDYRAAYYAGIGRPDPQLATAGGSSGSGVLASASVAAWPGRPRYCLTRSNRGGL